MTSADEKIANLESALLREVFAHGKTQTRRVVLEEAIMEMIAIAQEALDPQ